MDKYVVKNYPKKCSWNRDYIDGLKDSYNKILHVLPQHPIFFPQTSSSEEQPMTIVGQRDSLVVFTGF